MPTSSRIVGTEDPVASLGDKKAILCVIARSAATWRSHFIITVGADAHIGPL